MEVMMKKYVIERPINGISLNGNEQHCHPDGEPVLFITYDEAKQYLLASYDNPDDMQIDLDNGAMQINEYEE